MATPPQPPLPPCGPWKNTAEELGIISVSGDTESMADSHDHLSIVQPHYESNMGRLPHDFALRAPCPDDDEQGNTPSIAIITSSQSIMESQIMFNNHTRDSDEAPTIQRQQQQDVLVDSATITQDGVRTPAIATTSSLSASNQIRNTDGSNHVAASPPQLKLGRPIPRRRKCSVATMSRKKLCLVVILQNILLLGAIIAVIILAIDRSTSDTTTAKDSDGSSQATNAAVSTKDTILKRGYLICGVVERPGFSTYNGTTWTGFEVDLCRAIGAAIFGSGNDTYVKFTNLSISDRFVALRDGIVDLLAAGVTHTMERDLYEPTAKAGFAFSVPYLYNGLSFAGQPQYVKCAESSNAKGNCTGLRICVQDNTTHVQIVKNYFPAHSSGAIKLAPTRTDFYLNFKQGYCNVLAGEQFDLAERLVRQAGYTGNYTIGSNEISMEPIALVTRDDDVEWSDYVNWVFLALLTAETQSISQTIAQSVVDNPGPSVAMSQINFYHAVAAVGNYAEMYNRCLESIVPRAPVNMQNNGTAPLISSFPFGNNATMGPGPVGNGTLEKILQRGYLRCGTAVKTTFFADFNFSTQQWEGFDIDYCRAVSAAIFNGTGRTIFVPVSGTNRWELLESGEIDVLSWETTWNYERDVKEPSVKTGFTFTVPNFYTGLQIGGIPPYGDCANQVDVLSSNCKGLKICVKDGTTTIETLRRFFPNVTIFACDDDKEVDDGLKSGKCNAVAADGFLAAIATLRDEGYNGTYQEGTKLFSRENLAMVTRQDDPQWSSFVNWVVMATFYAQEKNIAQSTYDRMPFVNLFGPNFTGMLKNAILAVGSRGEIVARNNAIWQFRIQTINQLNTNSYGPRHFPPGGLFGLY